MLDFKVILSHALIEVLRVKLSRQDGRMVTLRFGVPIVAALPDSCVSTRPGISLSSCDLAQLESPR